MTEKEEKEEKEKNLKIEEKWMGINWVFSRDKKKILKIWFILI